MQIILVSSRLKKARTLSIMPRHVALAALALIFSVCLLAITFSWLSVHWRLPLVQDLILFLQMRETHRNQEMVNNNLQMMAGRLGELQAKVMQLDSQEERLSALASGREGAKGRIVAKEASREPASEESKPAAGRGGPFVAAPLTPDELAREIERLTQVVEGKTDEFAVLESRLLEKRVRERLLPTSIPVRGAEIGSGFGHRSDPILGLRAMHEGIDFNAETGTPVLAAAAGVVLSAEWHPEFGNMIDLDHGDGLTSRYAHLSRVDIKAGQLVRRGERLGAVGSTGRSTGSHLHFEVRMLGVAQDPATFLSRNSEFASLKRR